MPARAFLFDDSQAGCFHVVNRIYDRRYLLDTEGKDLLLKIVRAYEDVLGVEVLTFCIMDNHFHLLVRVPHRPEGFDVSLEVVVARLDRALGEESAKLMHRNLEFWRTTKNEAAIEEWRRQQVARMFSLSEFISALVNTMIVSALPPEAPPRELACHRRSRWRPAVFDDAGSFDAACPPG